MTVLLFFLLAAGISVSAAAPAETLPDWFIPLREAAYEHQLTADEILPLYRQVYGTARESLSGAPMYVMLSRTEYMMGRAFQFEERNREAAVHFEAGMDFAQRALDIQASSEGWQMLGENLSQLIAVRASNTFAMANGLRVGRYAQNALDLNSRNAAAQIMIAARWVYAPAPFNNLRRGLEMMKAIPYNSDMEKDDMFNVYVAIGFAYLQQRRPALARPWLLKALEVYPTNRFARILLDRT